MNKLHLVFTVLAMFVIATFGLSASAADLAATEDLPAALQSLSSAPVLSGQDAQDIRGQGGACSFACSAALCATAAINGPAAVVPPIVRSGNTKAGAVKPGAHGNRHPIMQCPPKHPPRCVPVPDWVPMPMPICVKPPIGCLPCPLPGPFPLAHTGLRR